MGNDTDNYTDADTDADTREALIILGATPVCGNDVFGKRLMVLNLCLFWNFWYNEASN